MQVQVLLFAQLREAVGADEVALTLSDGATVGAALDALAREHASIAALRDRIAVAVDDRYVRGDEVLRDGQSLALIPPVSGG